MTTLTNNYSFMDLLKDKNYVPNTDHGKTSLLLEGVEATKDSFARVWEDAEDYTFMDLLNDKGHVPVIIEEEAAIFNELEESYQVVSDFVEETTMDYDFIDLVMDNTFAFANQPSNDNERIYLTG